MTRNNEKIKGELEYPALDTGSYLDVLKNRKSKEGIADLRRSGHFRYEKDCEIIAESVEKNENNPEASPVRCLNIGVGNMEEIISYLAAVYPKLKGKKLEEVIDMELIEIRDKEEVKPAYRLGKQLFEKNKPIRPKAYGESFVLTEGEYELRPEIEIKEYVENLMENQSKAHFGIPVENFTSDKSDKFDVVSCNNVIQHMGGIEGYPSPYKNPMAGEYERYYREIGKILHLVKEGGLLFMHAPTPGDLLDTKGVGVKLILNNIPGFNEDFEELATGIFKRKVVKSDT